MAVLESCPKHNMAAYLEKTDGNAEFYEIIDFFARSSIYNALTLMNVHVPLDHFPVNALTSKVFSFMVKKGKHFSGKITPLFSNMLVQPTEDEGEQSERPSKPLPTPFPPHPSEVQVEPQSDPSPRPSPTTHIPDSIPEDSGGNQGGQSSSDRSLSGNEGGMTLQSVYDLCISLCTQVTNQAKEIKHLKARIKKLKKKAKPVIRHHRAWMKDRIQTGEKSAKAVPSVHKDPLFMTDDDKIDNMESEDAQGMGRTRHVVHEEKERKEKEVSTEDALGTDKQKDSTDKEKVSTDRPNEVLLNMSQAKAVSREKEKGVELKDVEETERPRPTSTRSLLTLKPLLKIDPKVKREKIKIKEEDESYIEEKVKRFDESFIAVGSTEDERKIKQVNEGAKDLKQKRLKKKVAKETPKNEDTAKVPAKVDVTEQGTKKRKGGHMKMLARKRKRPQPDVDSDDEHRKCLKIVTFEDWKIVTWRLYEACGVYTLELEDGTVIHMLVERRYMLVLAWMGRCMDIDGPGLGEQFTFDKD
ncbi:hypothetical protein Tco_0788189 [Tanacetum coccineum]